MKRLLLPAAMSLLVACNTQTNRLVVRADRLPSTSVTRTPHLLCEFNLEEVIDARPLGSADGGAGRHHLVFENVQALVREKLEKSGMTDAGEAPALRSRRVALQVKQLYLTTNQSSKVPVAVYGVELGDGSQFVVRSQATSWNWSGSEESILRAVARALDDANVRLIDALNARCGSNTD